MEDIIEYQRYNKANKEYFSFHFFESENLPKDSEEVIIEYKKLKKIHKNKWPYP